MLSGGIRSLLQLSLPILCSTCSLIWGRQKLSPFCAALSPFEPVKAYSFNRSARVRSPASYNTSLRSVMRFCMNKVTLLWILVAELLFIFSASFLGSRFRVLRSVSPLGIPSDGCLPARNVVRLDSDSVLDSTCP